MLVSNMGRGSRHSKNAGTMGSEAMTYAEMKGLGYGTVNERLGKVTVFFLPINQYYVFSTLTSILHALLDFMPSNTGSVPIVMSLPVLTCLLDMQDAVGNYYDCRLTLQPAVVSGL